MGQVATAKSVDICHCAKELDVAYRLLMAGEEDQALAMFDTITLCLTETPCVRALQVELALERIEEMFGLLETSRTPTDAPSRDRLLRPQ